MISFLGKVFFIYIFKHGTKMHQVLYPRLPVVPQGSALPGFERWIQFPPGIFSKTWAMRRLTHMYKSDHYDMIVWLILEPFVEPVAAIHLLSVLIFFYLFTHDARALELLKLIDVFLF